MRNAIEALQQKECIPLCVTGRHWPVPGHPLGSKPFARQHLAAAAPALPLRL